MDFGAAVAAEAIGGLVTATLLAVLVAYRDAGITIGANDREAVALGEDMARFRRDRDRLLQAELSAATSDAAARGVLYGGTLLASHTAVKRRALVEYRDEVTRKRRRYADLCAAETGASKVLRRRRGRLAAFALSDESREKLAEWRADVTGFGTSDRAPVDDPTSEEREPDIRRFEREGDEPS